MFIARKNLTVNNITNYVDEYSIIKLALPDFKGPGKYRSNLRYDDRNESLNVTVRGGKMIISDFGLSDSIGMNVYTYCRKVFGFPDDSKGFVETLSKIADSFDLPLSTISKYSSAINLPKGKIYNIQLSDAPEIVIRYRSRKYFSSKKDYEFWKPLLDVVSEEELIEMFKLFGVVFLSHYWINDECFTVKESSPTYCYKLGTKRKLYSPYYVKYKWVSNIPKTDVHGLDTLPETGDILIIDKSVKDCLVNHALGYYSIPSISESTFIPIDILNNLKKRFKRIYIHYDNDIPGIREAKKNSELYDLPYYYFPEEMGKDNFNVLEKHGVEVLKNYLLTVFK